MEERQANVSGKREEDRWNREGKTPTGGRRIERPGASRGHLTNGPAPGQGLPSAFSQSLGTEQSYSLDLGAGPEAGTVPHRLPVLHAKRHLGF